MKSEDVKEGMAVLIPEWIRDRQDEQSMNRRGSRYDSIRDRDTFNPDNSAKVVTPIIQAATGDQVSELFALVTWRGKPLLLAHNDLEPFRLHKVCKSCQCDPFPHQTAEEEEEEEGLEDDLDID